MLMWRQLVGGESLDSGFILQGYLRVVGVGDDL